MIELKPCPFCGGKPYIQVHELSGTCVESRVICRGCHVSTSRDCQSWRVWCGDDDLTRTLAIGRAISGWNRRAERTCRPEVCDDGAGAWGVYCSECCYRFVGPYGSRDLPERMAARRDIMPHYCSNCGAKVVDE